MQKWVMINVLIACIYVNASFTDGIIYDGMKILKPVIRSLINRIETGETAINPDTGNEEKIVRSEFVAWERINKFIVDVTRL